MISGYHPKVVCLGFVIFPKKKENAEKVYNHLWPSENCTIQYFDKLQKVNKFQISTNFHT